MAEAFVKSFKRAYVRINPIPDARTVLLRIDYLDGGLQLIPGWATPSAGNTLHHFNKPRVRSHGGNFSHTSQWTAANFERSPPS